MSVIKIDSGILYAFSVGEFDQFHALVDYIALRVCGQKPSYRELVSRWGWGSTKTVFDFVKKIEANYSPFWKQNGNISETLISAPLLGLSNYAETNRKQNGNATETLPTENGVSSQYNNARLTYLKEKHSTDKDSNPISENLYNESLSSECKESEKKKPIKNIIPPTVEMVRAYCEERHNGIDPEQFVDFYTSKGWMIGKDKMKDWQSAVRTWEKGRKQNAQERTVSNRPKTLQEKMNAIKERERELLRREREQNG